MTLDEVVARARRCIGKGCVYSLGRGGFDPDRLYPWGNDDTCDCSGFAAWCMGVSRQTDHPWFKAYNGGWVETTAITRDARAQGVGMFDELKWTAAKPGHLIVWGDHAGRQGHVGIVSEADHNGPQKVIHCSKGNWKDTNDAIRETSSAIFRANGAIVARCAVVDP